MRKTRSVMEHVVTYVETYLVRFLKDTFHTKRDRLEVESVKTTSVQRDFSRLEYDFQSRPIGILSRHSRQSLTDNIKQQVTHQADTSSDEEFSSTEHLHTDLPTITKRKKKRLKRKREFKEQLMFGIEI